MAAQRHRAATTALSAATEGRSSRRSSHSDRARVGLDVETERLLPAEDPGNVRDVCEAELAARQVGLRLEDRVERAQGRVEPLVRPVVTPPHGVVRAREVVVPPDAQSRQCSLRGVCGEQGRLGETLLEVLHDHGRLGKHEAAVLLDHGDAPGGVLLVQPRRLVAEVDPDALVRDLLLGQDDAHPPDVRAALGVVESEHASILDG